MSHRRIASAVLILLAAGASAPALQDLQSMPLELEVDHVAPSCLDPGGFPFLAVSPPSDATPRDPRLYFKASDDDLWYYVAIREERNGRLQAVLPRPLPEARRVEYAFTWSGSRSEPFTVDVLKGGCPGAHTIPPERLSRDIDIGRDLEDQPASFPLGFSTERVSVGGGFPLLGIVGGAGAAAGVGVLTVGSSESDTMMVDAPRAEFTISPSGRVVKGDPVTFDASASTATTYAWDFGDGRDDNGRRVVHAFARAGMFKVRLTVTNGDERSDSAEQVVDVFVAPNACFIMDPSVPGGGSRIQPNESVRFDADCSLGDKDGLPVTISSYSWDFDDGRAGKTGKQVQRVFFDPGKYVVTLTVKNEFGEEDTAQQEVDVAVDAMSLTDPSQQTANGSARAPEIAFTSHLDMAAGDGSARARVVLNRGRADVMSNAAPFRHQMRARPGTNTVEGFLASGDGEGRWRFDFAGNAAFVAGSLQVELGQVIARDATSVVFRVRPSASERIKFRFEATR